MHQILCGSPSQRTSATVTLFGPGWNQKPRYWKLAFGYADLPTGIFLVPLQGFPLEFCGIWNYAPNLLIIIVQRFICVECIVKVECQASAVYLVQRLSKMFFV